MQKKIFKKTPLLGLVLMAASVVTAAIVPSKSKKITHENSANNGLLLNASGLGIYGGVNSCVYVSGAPNCHYTESLTGDDSSLVGDRTDNNTSHTNSMDSFDSTSLDS